MKKQILLILSLILLLPAILFGYGASLPSYYSDSYYGELAELYTRLQNTSGPKIVILGNSNVAFGVDSSSLEASLREHGYDYSVCNFGFYAAVGTSAMLSLSENCLNEGDLVVLAIEPDSDAFSSYFGATAMLKCTEENPWLLLKLNADQRSAVVGNYLEYLQDRAEIQRSGILPAAEGVYAKTSFDERGDMIYEREGNTMALGYDTAAPIDLSGLTFEPEFIEQVNTYIASARRKGAEVVLSFSPMNKKAVTDISEETVYQFFRKLADAFDCSVISDPNNYLLESGWFYDSNVHLNSAGMIVRTHQLLLDLLTWMGCSDKVSFEMPEMPASIAAIAGNDIDTKDFLYEEIGDSGLMVSGLTEEGMTKTALTLPSVVDGQTVIGISSEALGSNHILTELTLPATVESIPDGLFTHCPSVTRLNLLHRELIPEVGSGLLIGADSLKIYVTQEAYSQYRDGAGCAANNWERYEDRIVVIV